MGSGVCVLDYDNDGCAGHPLRQLHGLAGATTSSKSIPRFTTTMETESSPTHPQAGLAVEMYGMGCAVGDFDNDGKEDIYITAVNGNHLFHNLGNGGFADVTARSGLTGGGFSTGAVWFDYDNDGKLDLFVAHYVDLVGRKRSDTAPSTSRHKSYCTPQVYKGAERSPLSQSRQRHL